MPLKRHLLLTLILLLVAALPLSAATRIWTGAASANWSDPGNWGGTAPVSGDTLHFPAAGANKNSVNDLPANTRINGMVIEPGYTLSGNAIDIGADIVMSSGSTITMPLRLVSNLLFYQINNSITVGSPIDLNGQMMGALTQNSSVTFTGVISGAGEILKNHAGGPLSDLVLAGNNSYTGYTRVNGGRLIVPNANGLGSSSGILNRTIIYSGGTLIVQNALISEPLEIGGPGYNNEGALQTTGDTTFNGTLTLFEQARAVIEGTLDIFGRVTGAGGLTLAGSGELTLHFNGNDFAGPVLWLDHNSGVDIIAGVDNALPTTLDLVIPAPAAINLAGHVQRLRSISGYGNVSLGGGELLLTNATGVWDGQIIGAGNVYVIGGAMEIVDANIITGDFAISGATTMTFSGNGWLTTSTRYVQDSGTTIITGGAHLNGPVNIDAGQLRINGIAHTGNLTLSPDATYVEAIAGPAAAQYGNLHVTGTVNLDSATFTLNQTALVPAGALMIIDNDDADAINGTFNGLPEGAIVPGGMQAFTISYIGGDGNDVVLLAAAVNTTTTLTSNPNPSTVGQNVTLTATVTATTGTATGTVTFFDGATNLGTAPVNASGVATLTLNTLAQGTHDLTAQYSGNATFNASTSAIHTHTVNALVATTTALTSSPNPSTSGQAVTLTATVTPANGGTPTGTVTFFDGSTNLGSATPTNGTATLTISTLTAGTHSLTAQYSGNASFSGSTSPAHMHTVNAAVATTTTTLTSSPNPSTTAQSVTLTATVTSSTAGTPTGNVTFFDGATNLGTVTLTDGTATLTITTLSAGTHNFTAQYSGDPSFSGSTSAVRVQTVNAAATTTTLTSNPNPSLANQAVTFTATVTSATPGTRTGTVTFRDGTTVLGTVALTNGTATLTISTLTPGSHAITATYNGDATYASSTSNAVTQVVAGAPGAAEIPTASEWGLIFIAVSLALAGAFSITRN